MNVYCPTSPLYSSCGDRREDGDLDAEHLEKLRHICRTHRQPARSIEKCEVSKVQRNSVISETLGGEQNLITQVLSCSSGTAAPHTHFVTLAAPSARPPVLGSAWPGASHPTRHTS
ncbi:unnamed protein product [Leuciscus chuanchicus]